MLAGPLGASFSLKSDLLNFDKLGKLLVAEVILITSLKIGTPDIFILYTVCIFFYCSIKIMLIINKYNETLTVAWCMYFFLHLAYKSIIFSVGIKFISLRH